MSIPIPVPIHGKISIPILIPIHDHIPSYIYITIQIGAEHI